MTLFAFLVAKTKSRIMSQVRWVYLAMQLPAEWRNYICNSVFANVFPVFSWILKLPFRNCSNCNIHNLCDHLITFSKKLKAEIKHHGVTLRWKTKWLNNKAETEMSMKKWSCDKSFWHVQYLVALWSYKIVLKLSGISRELQYYSMHLIDTDIL